MISSTVRIGLLGLVALLALTGLGGTTLAAGDLFDDAYRDCPHKTRLRDGQIDDLTVNRDADDEDHVNVSWTATDPAAWGLGPNAYSTSLVVILDDKDGDPVAKTLSLGSTKTTFEGIKTGTEVTVQMAIVVDTAEGDYLISDILERSINQSLTAPDFSGPWHRMRRTDGGSLSITLGGTAISRPAPDIRLKGLKVDGASPLTGTELAASLKQYDDVLKAKDFQFDSEMVANGRMYYIGYNENFANYRPGTTNPAAYAHSPSTPRLRIGLAHGNETDGERDDVDFDAYLIRIEDADGDVVQEGDDVATVATDYGALRIDYIWDTDGVATSGTAGTQGFKAAARKLFVDDLAAPTGGLPVIAVNDRMETTPALHNVRIVDGSDIAVGLHLTGVNRNPTGNTVSPPSLSIIRVDVGKSASASLPPAIISGFAPDRGSNPLPEALLQLPTGEVYANPPDEHRDFPIDTLSSDETYTITAWAVNEDDEVISPVATLNLHPVDKTVTLGTATGAGLRDYLNTTAITSGTLIVTEFTVLK